MVLKAMTAAPEVDAAHTIGLLAHHVSQLRQLTNQETLCFMHLS
jgi:hypothetical protein